VAKRTQKTASKATPIPQPTTTVPLSEQGFIALSKTKYGWIAYNKHDQYIGGSIEHYGEFSEGEVDFFRQTLRPGDVVVEAGANIGTHTVAMAQMVGAGGRVLAFEPQRLVFQNLCANIALNSLDNVMTFQAALGPQPGNIIVPLLDPNQANNFGGLGVQGHAVGEPVPVMTIDSLNLARCRLIKADVEGMEHEVLSGAKETIKRLRPVLYVENDRELKSEALISLIQNMGYRLWWHLPALYNPNNFKNNPENIFKGLLSVNMLCLPNEMHANIELNEIKTPQDHWKKR
jgi:FkbM family methyltransferase